MNFGGCTYCFFGAPRGRGGIPHAPHWPRVSQQGSSQVVGNPVCPCVLAQPGTYSPQACTLWKTPSGDREQDSPSCAKMR